MLRAIFAAAGAACVAAAPATAQVSAQSGPLTFTLQVAKHVEVVSDASSLHDITGRIYGPAGIQPGKVFSSSQIHTTNPIMREVRANTPFRAMIIGLQPDGMLLFRNGRGDEIRLPTACDMLTTPDPASRTAATFFDCLASPVFQPGQGMATRWMLFHTYVSRKGDTSGAAAGVYTATIYFQIDAT